MVISTQFATHSSMTRNEFPNSKDEMVCPPDERSLYRASTFQLKDSQAKTSGCVRGGFEFSIFPLYKVSIAFSRSEVKHLKYQTMISVLESKCEFT